MLKRFLPYYRPYIGLLCIDLGAALALALVDLAFPAVTQQIVDVLIPAKNFAALGFVAGGLVLLYFLRAGLEYTVAFKGHVLGVSIQRDLRRDIFRHLQSLDTRFFDDTKTGQIMSRVVTDLFDIAEFSHHAPEDLLVATVRLLGSLALMLVIDWRLALIVFAVVPVQAFVTSKWQGRFRKAFRKAKETMAAINERLEENISAARVVRAFGREEHECELFDEGNGRFWQARIESVKTLGQFDAVTGLLSNLSLVVVLAAGGFAAMRGSISIGNYVAFTLYVARFLQPLEVLVRSVEMFQDGAAGFRRFLEVMDRKPAIADAPGAVVLADVRGEIAFENVGFRYSDDRDRVLHDINLRVPAGSTVAIVGPSGAGKSTLCNLLPRFYEVEEGAISIDGLDLRRMTIASLRSTVGIVQQDVFLFSGTIRDNLAYGRLGATEEEIREACRSANALDFIEGFPEGFDAVIGERGIKLSGGQKQRLAIARMFLRNPPILILDEATSSLDAVTEAGIRDSLERLAQGRTTLIIAHRLATIRRAGRIIVLTEDGIVEDGSHDELMKKDGPYRRLFEAQVEGLLVG